MKIKSLFLPFLFLPMLVKGNGGLDKSTPRLAWIKQQVNSIFSSGTMVNGQKVSDVLKFQEDKINPNNVLFAQGKFLSKDQNQIIITVPCEAKAENLGWETNLLLLIDKNETGDFILKQIL